MHIPSTWISDTLNGTGALCEENSDVTCPDERKFETRRKSLGEDMVNKTVSPIC
jgi:hypothetical protein